MNAIVNEDNVDERQILIDRLAAEGISSAVLSAMARVSREKFVPRRLRSMAYVDSALPIECGQTISQPTIVAMMTDALSLSGNERVLEIGTGSGYQAAILAELCRFVVTIERHGELARQAASRLKEMGYSNVLVLHGDGTLGCPEHAPFDRIIVTAAADDLPPALFAQLAEGGFLVAPLGDVWGQTLVQIRKVNGAPVRRELCGCAFVPLVADESIGQLEQAGTTVDRCRHAQRPSGRVA
ncbi:MAG TPA: protein-L-isoaspartate(D-aspartate) O-methyltransferase [Pirellulales bacterium]|nr:protein-L-isoaspartate(D-aspartate) O-methyltransferase [Pirellulales bacterium]